MKKILFLLIFGAFLLCGIDSYAQSFAYKCPKYAECTTIQTGNVRTLIIIPDQVSEVLRKHLIIVDQRGSRLIWQKPACMGNYKLCAQFNFDDKISEHTAKHKNFNKIFEFKLDDTLENLKIQITEFYTEGETKKFTQHKKIIRL